MIDALAFSITVVAVLAAPAVGVQAARHRFRWARVAPTLALLELALLVQAAFDLAGLLGGHRPREPATHLAYLVVSVLVVPVIAVQVRADDGRWSALLLLIGLLVLAVLVVRLQTTWRSASG